MDGGQLENKTWALQNSFYHVKSLVQVIETWLGLNSHVCKGAQSDGANKNCQPSWTTDMATAKLKFAFQITCPSDKNVILVSIPMFGGLNYTLVLTVMGFALSY